MSDRSKKAARRHRRTASKSDGAIHLSTTAKGVLWALPITVAVGLLLLFVASALLLTTKDPDRYHTAMGYTLLYLTACIGGAVATRLCHRRTPLLCGFAEALLLLLAMTIIGIFLPNEWKSGSSAGVALLTRVLLLPASIGGALLAAREKKKARRRH